MKYRVDEEIREMCVREREGTRGREVIRVLGNDFGYSDPEESTTDNAVMNYSRRNVELIAYNAIVRDTIPRTQRYIV